MTYIKNKWATGDIITQDKLNNIETGIESAQYVLPIATTTTLGGVKVDGTSIIASNDGEISAHVVIDDEVVNTSITTYMDEHPVSAEVGNGTITESKLSKSINDNLCCYQPIEYTEQQGYINKTNATFKEDVAYRTTKIDVNEGEKFQISATIKGALTALVLFVDSDNTILSSYKDGTSTAEIITDLEVTAPKNVKYMLLTWISISTNTSIKKFGINNLNEIKQKISNPSNPTNIIVPGNLENSNLSFDDTNVTVNYDGKDLTAKYFAPKNIFVPCYFNCDRSITYRHTNNDTFLILYATNSSYITLAIGTKTGGQINEFIGTAVKTIKTATYKTFNLGDIIRVTIQGSIVNLYVNGNTILTQDMSELTFSTADILNHPNIGFAITWDNYKNILASNIQVYNSCLDNQVLIDNSKIISIEESLDFNIYKKAVFLGDSITYGTHTTKIYHDYMKELLSIKETVNYGIGNTTIASTGGNGFVNRFTTMDDDADLIVVFGGTNDFGHHIPMGENSSTDNTNFIGALHELCQGLINKYLGKKIIFITPLNRSCDLFPANNCPSGQKTNNLNLSLLDYVNKMLEIVPEYSIPIYDLYHNSNLYPYNTTIATNYIPDGLHPNAEGHRIIAEKIANFIRNN